MNRDVLKTLFPEQQHGLLRMRDLAGKGGLFMEMGTGKTRTALLYTLAARAKRTLVVCPLSVVGVWERECRLVEYDNNVTDLTSAGTIKERAQEMRRTGDSLTIVNYESYWREPLRSAIVKWKPDAVIFDEAHRLRNRGARHSRFSYRFPDLHIPTRLALTGTPSVNGLQDVWSIFRFVNPDVFGKRWQDFESRYLVMGGFHNLEIKDYVNLDDAHARIAANSFQAKKRADLPERQDVPVPVRLEASTRVRYEQLRADSVLEILHAGTERRIIASIALTLLLRLQQITSGFVRDTETGDDIDLGSEKVDTARGLIEDAVDQGHKIVVFCRFLRDVERVQASLPAHIRSVVYTGKQTSRERTDIRDDFHAGKYDVIVAQIKAAALGIDLTPANVAIFFSVGFSLDDFLQAKDRLHRQGQTRPVTYYHLLAENTVDEKVYDALRAKMSLASRVTDLTYALDLFAHA